MENLPNCVLSSSGNTNISQQPATNAKSVAVPSERPPITCDALLKCRIQQWYPKFKSQTFKSAFIGPLPIELLKQGILGIEESDTNITTASDKNQTGESTPDTTTSLNSDSIQNVEVQKTLTQQITKKQTFTIVSLIYPWILTDLKTKSLTN